MAGYRSVKTRKMLEEMSKENAEEFLMFDI